jgi:hypothetical protein
MAEHSTVEFNAPPLDDYPAHLQAYEGFLGVVKWGSIATIIVLVLMAFFLV